MPKTTQSKITTNLELINYTPANLSSSIPILFVHGMWHGAWCWEETFLPYFDQKGFQCSALSFIGHGKSPNKRFFRFTRTKDYVRNLRSITEQYSTHPLLVGHSMGGFVVQKYLEKYEAPGAVLLASIPHKGTLTTTIRYMLHHPVAFMKTNLTMKMKYIITPKKLAKEYLFSNSVSDTKLQKFYPLLQNEAYFAYLDTMLFALPKTKKINTPILVLGGEKDKFFDTKQFQSMAKAYNAPIKLFPGMAHNMMLQDGWEAVADEIVNWTKHLSN